MKAFKIAAIGIGSLVGLLIVLMIAIPYFFKDKIVDAALQAANESLTARIVVDPSDVHFSLFSHFPNFTLAIEDFAIEVAPYAKGVQFVSREDALQTLKDDLGEDFVEFVGDNPLNDRIDVFFRAEYADSRQVDSVATMLMKNDFVDSVDYNRIMLDEINSNIRTISLWLGAFAILFLVVSILLINNSVRLTIYSKRFTIRTMQLVGATPKFIRRPFVNRLVGSALISAFIALILLSGIVYYLYQWQPEYRIVLDLRLIGALYCGLVVISVLITMISGRTAVRKFLGMRAEDLYY